MAPRRGRGRGRGRGDNNNNNVDDDDDDDREQAPAAAPPAAAPRTRREIMHQVARNRAEFFATFNDDDDDNGHLATPTPSSDAGDAQGRQGEGEGEGEGEEEEQQQQEEEEWYGPFSTARRLIRERDAAREGRLNRKKKQKKAAIAAQVIQDWSPSEENLRLCNSRPLASSRGPLPSLFDLSLEVLCDYAECIESLVGVPDLVRRKIAVALASRRRLSTQIFRCLAGGATSELIAADCSHVDEADMENILLDEVDVSILESLELGQCGRSWTDKVALAFTTGIPSSRRDSSKDPSAEDRGGSSKHSSPRLKGLTVLKIGGAYRLSDNGLQALVEAAPSVRHLSLTYVSRLTSNGLSMCLLLLSQTLHTLVLDGCVDLADNTLTEALKALVHLRQLSLRELPGLSPAAVLEIVKSKGSQLQGLLLGGSTGALTDGTVEAIASHCQSIESLDFELGNSIKPESIEQLAKSCRMIKELILSRCQLLTSECLSSMARSLPNLKRLHLNSIVKVDDRVLLALVEGCHKFLAEIDLSFCREVTDKALGYMADNLSELRMLKLYGCSQVSKCFIYGHRNPNLFIKI